MSSYRRVCRSRMFEPVLASARRRERSFGGAVAGPYASAVKPSLNGGRDPCRGRSGQIGLRWRRLDNDGACASLSRELLDLDETPSADALPLQRGINGEPVQIERGRASRAPLPRTRGRGRCRRPVRRCVPTWWTTARLGRRGSPAGAKRRVSRSRKGEQGDT